MANYKTPGVYVEEIVTLGSSVAAVPTAIPGFVGYTEKAVLADGSSATNKPVRITSILEYQQYFGGPFNEKYTVALTGTLAATSIAITPTSIGGNSLSSFTLFYQMQMFFANGGGACYVVSVGNYSATIAAGTMVTGVGKLEQIDEVTLLVVPEAVVVASSGGVRKTIYEAMATQCNKLQDRFAILDVEHVAGRSIYNDAVTFRSQDIGSNYLKYTAAYYPALITPTIYSYIDADVTITDTRTGAIYNTTPNNNLYTISNGVSSFNTFTVGSAIVATDALTITIVPVTTVVTLTAGTDYAVGGSLPASIANLVAAINAHPVLSKYVEAKAPSPIVATFTVISKLPGTIGNYTWTGAAKFGTPGAFAGGVNNSADKSLYNRIDAELAKNTLTLYPSASMAGVYASVDNDRGVWKAPANVSVALVAAPSVNVSAEDQENLNVDSVSGKSINAIRAFTGRGVMVWGARTLAGNDNEWRYVNVRRLFIFVEESVKKASEFVVFESNSAPTWQRVKGMCEAFLTGLWRDGALAGATTKDAFFVNVGLGTTMTPDDILNGKMVVEIGMAASRPAEFIILRFSHKLQES